MKLYVFEHCPFCARCLYVAHCLSINLEVFYLPYSDDITTKNIIGEKLVPLLIDKGEALSGYLEIMERLIETCEIADPPYVSRIVVLWQEKALPVYKQIVYPRFRQLNLTEFRTVKDVNCFLATNQTFDFDFDVLIEKSDEIADEALEVVDYAKRIILEHKKERLSLADQAVLFSFLRGFFLLPRMHNDEYIKRWLLQSSRAGELKIFWPPEEERNR